MTDSHLLPEGPQQPDGEPQDEPAPNHSVIIKGDNHGIVSTGPNAINAIFIDDQFVQVDNVMELPLAPMEPLPSPPLVPLFGRDAVVDQIVQQLTTGGSAQLHGPEGVGKKAIANAVHHRLAAAGVHGVVLRPIAGQDKSLAEVYTRLARLFFRKNFLRAVDESALRTRGHGISSHISLVDCMLDREEVVRLQETFPRCTFLLTSPHRTVSGNALAIHVQPLPQAAALELLGYELGLPDGPAGLQNPQFEHVYQMSEGRPQRLLLFAEYIKNSDEWRTQQRRELFDQPALIEPGHISAQHQAEALAVALSEPARRLLVSLAAHRAPLPPAWCAAFTGITSLATGVEAAAELYDRRLVTREEDRSIAATPDAIAALAALGWGSWDPVVAAEDIQAVLATPDPALRPTEPPDPLVLLHIAHALDSLRQWPVLAEFVKVTAPLALQAGQGHAAVQLYLLGQKASSLSGAQAQAQAYLRTGQRARTILEGDNIAVAAALTLTATGTVSVGTAAGQQATHHAAGAARNGSRILRRLISFAQAKPAVAVVAAIAVAGGGAAAAVALANSGNPGKPAGCATALTVVDPRTDPTNPQVPLDLVPYYQRLATGLSGAAGEATDPAVKSALQTRSDELNTLANAQESAGNSTVKAVNSKNNDSTMYQDMDPSVVADFVRSAELQVGIENLQAVNPVCGLD